MKIVYVRQFLGQFFFSHFWFRFPPWVENGKPINSIQSIFFSYKFQLHFFAAFTIIQLIRQKNQIRHNEENPSYDFEIVLIFFNIFNFFCTKINHFLWGKITFLLLIFLLLHRILFWGKIIFTIISCLIFTENWQQE